MDVEVTHAELGAGAVVVRAVGELDVYTAGKWRNYALGVLTSEAPRHLGLDMSEVTYFDSMAVGGLVKIFKDHQRAPGSPAGAFALIGCQEHARKVMKVTGLERLMPCVDGVDDFLALVLAAGTVEAGPGVSVKGECGPGDEPVRSSHTVITSRENLSM